MRTIRLGRLAAMTLAIGLVLGACGGSGGGGPTNDPAGSVTNALAAVTSGGVGKLTDFACAAHKNDLAAAFSGSSGAALAAAGIKAEDAYAALSLSFANVTAKETSRSGTKATVHVTTDMAIKVDAEKFKALMKAALVAQGQSSNDAAIDAMVSMWSGQLSTTQKLDEDISVVNEGGNWLLCE